MGERMGWIDRAWLRMDSSTSPMVITALLDFEGGFPFDELVAVARGRVAAQPHFRCRAAPSGLFGATSTWEEVAPFDAATLVERRSLGPDPSALRALVSSEASRPLDPSGPLWRLVHVDRGPAGVAVIARIHHALGDGVALVRALLDVASPGARPRPVAGIRLEGWSRAFRGRVRRAGVDVRALAGLLALPHEPPSSLRPALSGQKLLAWTGPLPFEVLHARARGLGATLTDLVVAALALALEEEHLACAGAPLPSARALVPVFVHGEEGPSTNRFGLVFLPLPLDGRALEDRVRAVHAALSALRSAPDTEVALLVLGAMGLLPKPLQRLGTAIFTGKASLLLTSVPGPRDVLSIGGRPLTGLVVAAPVAGTVGMSVSVLSQADAVRVCVATDRALPHDPQRLVERLERLL